MLYYSPDKKLKSIIVSSVGPGEGKTTTVANLAITFANMGKKTLLIDGDLRRPVLHTVFNIEKTPGLTEHLVDSIKDPNEIIMSTSIKIYLSFQVAPHLPTLQNFLALNT